MATKTGLMSADIVDKYGITATTDAFISIDDTQTIAALVTDLDSYLTALQAITDGKISKGYIRVNTDLTFAGTPAGDVEKGGLFNFNNASDPYAQGYWVPDIAASVLNSSGLINLTNVSVASFITFMTTAHTVITVVTKGVRALTSLRDALISFRKRRKALTRRTKE